VGMNEMTKMNKQRKGTESRGKMICRREKSRDQRMKEHAIQFLFLDPSCVSITEVSEPSLFLSQESKFIHTNCFMCTVRDDDARNEKGRKMRKETLERTLSFFA
jgi:hypothetical protein